MWIQTGVTVRKWQNLVLISVTLTFNLWPWLFAWASLLLMIITSDMKISRWYDDGNILKKVWQTDRRTDRQTDLTIHRAAWSQLKKILLGIDHSIKQTLLLAPETTMPNKSLYQDLTYTELSACDIWDGVDKLCLLPCCYKSSDNKPKVNLN